MCTNGVSCNIHFNIPSDALAFVSFPDQGELEMRKRVIFTLLQGANRWSRIEVMNISDEPIDVTIKFFNQFGFIFNPLAPTAAVLFLVGVGDLMYSSADPDGNRASLYERIGQ
jgi:hypothetical protein